MRAGADYHVLQEGLTPMPGRPEVLYLASGGFDLAAGGVLSTDSYFNSFYLGPWREHARVGRLGVLIEAEGQAGVRVIGIAAAGARHVLGEGAAGGVFWLDALGTADLTERADICRLVVEVEAATACRIARLAYVTDIAPANDIRLSIGICTFRREAYLAGTMAALAKARAETPEICAVRVVNQGPSFTDPALATQIEAVGAEVIEQANLGGCGGFARTMFEAAMADDLATHHLLMDDDIVIDARVIARAIRFAAYARHPLSIGGQMLDIFDPVRVYEVAGVMDAGWRGMSIGKDVDLSKTEGLALFDAPGTIHYNGWWWCMVPAATIRGIGLPAPYFIRGDDVEYGCRATAHGVPTVPLPGVAVWHESFGFKLSDWLTYYDVRNRLVNAALYPQFAAPLDALYLLGVFFNYMLLHRYAAAPVIAMAVRDYLAGPEALAATDSETRHHRLMAAIARLPAPEVVEDIDPATYQPAASSVSFLKYDIGDTVRGFAATYARISLTPVRARPILFRIGPNHPALVGGRGYAMPLDIGHSRYAVFRPSRLRLWGNTLRVGWTMLGYLVRRRGAVRRWRTGFAALTDAGAWQKQFAIPRGRDLD
ncbi:glycosyltransferase family 2 protein [Maritimibacter fusiformis]|uniref:Glycosyltransferase family 2 protein n=1 Tax=Maritimibacter fusiformis TaxID=2603819 RepID=A0A5D0RLY1_9RHOB|nr:glycosyltransferase [Maritimibacter fusiformis]TYB81751.1 glycosyltransferase family 2 protein [Maritimibacter fusiformis]